MPSTILQPTANESADSTQGGLAVSSPTNSGHAATTSSVVGSGIQTKTCRWSGFAAAPPGQVLSAVLKVDWQENGSLANAGSSLFRIQYSTSGSGGPWNNLISHPNVTSAAGPTTASVALSVGQDLTQVQVRDFLQTSGGDVGDSASLTGTVSNVLLEIVTSSGACAVMM